jgi:outer membrane protein, heavy metal efflux system
MKPGEPGFIRLLLLSSTLVAALAIAGCASPSHESASFRSRVNDSHSSAGRIEPDGGGSISNPKDTTPSPSASHRLSAPFDAEPSSELQHVEALTLQEAARRTLARNAKWRMTMETAMGRNASAFQNQLLDNPQVNFQWENILGTGAFSGDQQAERTVQLSQAIPIGGRIGANRKVTARTREASFLELEALRLEILRDLGQSYIQAYAAQLRLDISEQAVGLHEKIVEAVKAQVDAGKASPVELSQATTQFSLAKGQMESAKRDWIVARARLSKYWNEPPNDPSYSSLSADWDVIPSALNEDVDWGRFQNHPRILWANSKLELAQARITAAKKASLPDITLQGAYRELEAPGEEVYVLGFTVPVPLFDRNQGTIEAARRSRSAAEAELEGILFEMELESRAALSAMESSLRTVRFLRDEAVPAADSALASAREGYSAGKFSFIETLNAQQAWNQTQLQVITATESLHLSVIQLETWLNAPLEELMAN